MKEVKGDLDVQSFVRGDKWVSYAPELVRTSDEDARQDFQLDAMLWSFLRCVLDALRAARSAEEAGWDVSGIFGLEATFEIFENLMAIFSLIEYPSLLVFTPCRATQALVAGRGVICAFRLPSPLAAIFSHIIFRSHVSGKIEGLRARPLLD